MAGQRDRDGGAGRRNHGRDFNRRSGLSA
jgi:hypothetical protein